MDFQELFKHLREFDTPTICNALEIASGSRELSSFTQQTLIAASSHLPAIVGFARTAKIRCSTPYDAAQRKQNRISYYEYVASGQQPSIAVIEDIDERPGVGAFWGEVNTHVHRGLGCIGTLTNGSMRDLDAMDAEFQCLAGSLGQLVAGIGQQGVGLLDARGCAGHAMRGCRWWRSASPSRSSACVSALTKLSMPTATAR